MLRTYEGVRILHWRGFQPGAFGGFAQPSQTHAFDATMEEILGGNGWCVLNPNRTAQTAHMLSSLA